MLDIKFIRENTDAVRKAIADKRINFDLDELLEVDTQRRALLAETETLQATKNAVSKEIPTLSAEDRQVKVLEMKEVDSKQDVLKEKLKPVEVRYEELMLSVPNVTSSEAPIGKDDSENIPVSYWSKATGLIDASDESAIEKVKTKFDFEIKDHVSLGTDLDLIDLERGVEVSGFRGYFLKNDLVRLQQALFSYVTEKLVVKGFTLMQTPTIVREFALIGSGHFPGDREGVYQVGNAANLESDDKERAFLAGTSEPSLIAYYANQILDEAQLPIQLCGISPCYRSEVGSYGKDAKGLYRVHEFQKVEQVIICKADLVESGQWHETLRKISEEILQDLGLPYRVLDICTGDMGAGKYKMYDIETWMPGRDNFGETHSDSNLTDWQARRLNIRYRDSEGKVQYAYTLNNTAVASPRILIPILENYQQADGSVKIPTVLQKYMGAELITKK